MQPPSHYPGQRASGPWGADSRKAPYVAISSFEGELAPGLPRWLIVGSTPRMCGVGLMEPRQQPPVCTPSVADMGFPGWLSCTPLHHPGREREGCTHGGSGWEEDGSLWRGTRAPGLVLSPVCCMHATDDGAWFAEGHLESWPSSPHLRIFLFSPG